MTLSSVEALDRRGLLQGLNLGKECFDHPRSPSFIARSGSGHSRHERHKRQRRQHIPRETDGAIGNRAHIWARLRVGSAHTARRFPRLGCRAVPRERRLALNLQSVIEIEGGEDALRAARRENETLYAVIKTVSSSLDLDRVLRGIVDIATDATGCHACFIYFLEGDRLVLRAASPQYARLRRRGLAGGGRGARGLGRSHEDPRVHPRERDGGPAHEVRARAGGGAASSRWSRCRSWTSAAR